VAFSPRCDCINFSHYGFSRHRTIAHFFSTASLLILFLLTTGTLLGLQYISSIYAGHCVEYVPAIDTISLSCGTANLFDILDDVGKSKTLYQESDGVWVLSGNIVVGNSATLNINSTYTKWLKINSTKTPDPFHIHVLGNLNLDNTKISSWDFKADNYTTDNGSLPRPYITILPNATGTTIINNSEISFLGYQFPLREGLSFYGGQNVLAGNRIHDQYYGITNGTDQLLSIENILYNNIVDIANSTETSPQRSQDNATDLIRPFISIRYPNLNATIPYQDLTVYGTAFDEHSGIEKVEVFEHTFPFNNQYPYKVASPVNGSWSNWEYHLNISEPGLHRISARVTDLNGNQGWAESLLYFTFQNFTNSGNYTNMPLTKRIAVVDPLFTDGAYNVGGFYEFYAKYDNIPERSKVRNDLDLLTARIPDYDLDSKKAALLLINQLRMLTNTTIYNISDEDIHEGYIFNKDGTNAYDTLFFLHHEYATKESYSNLKHFVSNGGTVVFIDTNVLYAEVAYNPELHTVTLLRGHDWKFDGDSAEKSVHERWFNENRDWMGSNFLWSHIDSTIPFSNNPFNYTHFEENYVSNPKAHILYDYGAQIPTETLRDNFASKPLHIASYTLQHGKGKVLVLGLFGQRLLNNGPFLDFFDNLIFSQAVGTPYFLKNITNPLYYYSETGNMSKVELNGPGHLTFQLDRNSNASDVLFLSVPKELLSINGTNDLSTLSVLINDKEAGYGKFVGLDDIGFTIPLSRQADKIDLIT
jgi:hypothetical protein